MNRQTLCAACLLSLSLSAGAIEPGPSSPAQARTEAWLQLQPGGSAASTTPQPVTPEERELSLQRWLKSYSHEIPDFFDQEKGGKISGGSGK